MSDGRNVLLPSPAVTSDDDGFKSDNCFTLFYDILPLGKYEIKEYWEIKVIPEYSGTLKNLFLRGLLLRPANALPRATKFIGV